MPRPSASNRTRPAVTTRRMLRIATLAPVLAGALLVQGCSGGSTVSPNAPAAGSVTRATADPVAPACLTGSWRLQNETFEAAMSSMVLGAAEIPDAVKDQFAITLSGDSVLRFDGAHGYASALEGFTMKMSIGDTSTRHVQDSTSAGSYGNSDSHVWIYDVELLTMNAEMLADMGSVAIDGPTPETATVDFFGYTSEVPSIDVEQPDGAAAYTCSGDELRLESDGGVVAGFARIDD